MNISKWLSDVGSAIAQFSARLFSSEPGDLVLAEHSQQCHKKRIKRSREHTHFNNVTMLNQARSNKYTGVKRAPARRAHRPKR